MNENSIQDTERINDFLNKYESSFVMFNNIAAKGGSFRADGVVFNQNNKDAILTEQGKKASLGIPFSSPEGLSTEEVIDKMIIDILENM